MALHSASSGVAGLRCCCWAGVAVVAQAGGLTVGVPGLQGKQRPQLELPLLVLLMVVTWLLLLLLLLRLLLLRLLHG
jgi:hypothetical protein